MNINNISINNFRNLKNILIKPCDAVNVIYGENAQGKTNFIEAVWLFTGAKSFRGARDSELVSSSETVATLKTNFFLDKRNQTCEIKIEKNRTAVLNGIPLQSVSQLAGNICAIIFSPSDLNLITEGPNVRRKFLDTAICQLYPAYIDKLKVYNRALAQRNFVLKDLRYHSELSGLVEVFENNIATVGAEIIRYRNRYVERLSEFVPIIYGGFTGGKENLKIEYISNGSPDSEKFRQSLKNARKDDIITLSTSIGPHRDNVEIKINDMSIRIFGSQGQKRSAALSLKLSEAEVIKLITKQQPIALLDDVMSELDPGRQNYILNNINNRQVFITCCDPSNIKNLVGGKIFKMQDGILLNE